MKLLEGKNPTERNKIIAAAVLGLVALVALYFAFGRSFFGGTATATVKISPSPTPKASPAANNDKFRLPTADEQNSDYLVMPVVYYPGSANAPDAGRNIFAFYEPPPPTPYVPTPIPQEPIKTPPPTPVPPILIASYGPQAVYAGGRAFRLEIAGDKFTPDVHVYFNQTEMPTTFINTQRIVADIPANLIAREGSPQIIVQTPDGKAYSNYVTMTIQAPPRPTYLYIGMIGRKRYNNDTAYFTESEKSPPFGARLNDVLGARFRLVDISPIEVILEDVNLGFRHRIHISPPTTGGPPRSGPNDGFPPPFNPAGIPPNENPPGIPNTVQRYNPNMSEEEKKKMEQQQKQDVDDEGDG